MPPDPPAILSQSTPAPALPRRFGLAMGTFVVVSSMIGVGVLTTSGFTVASVGSNQLMLLLWVLGGGIALCGALCVAELAAALPASGGDYVYLYEAYGPLFAFLTGWVSFLLGFAAPIAATAFASASYLLAPLALEPNSARLANQLVATVAIVTFALIHTSRAGYASRAHAAVTVIKLGILTAFAAAGLIAGWGKWDHLVDRPPINWDLIKAMTFSLVYISYGYTGWNAASYLAGEVDEPGRKLPQAILIGTALVVALYMALNTVYALALPADEVRRIAHDRGFDAVAPIAQLAATRLFGTAVTAPLSVAFGLTLLASLSAYVLTGPRVALAMARAGHFPAAAGRLSVRTQAPVAATFAQTAWALVLLWSGSFENILIYASVGLALFSMLAVGSVVVLRRKRPDLPRPFRTPGYPAVPLVFLVGTGLLTAAAFTERPWPSLYSLLTILAGVPVYALVFPPRRGTPDASRFLIARSTGNVRMLDPRIMARLVDPAALVPAQPGPSIGAGHDVAIALRPFLEATTPELLASRPEAGPKHAEQVPARASDGMDPLGRDFAAVIDASQAMLPASPRGALPEVRDWRTAGQTLDSLPRGEVIETLVPTPVSSRPALDMGSSPVQAVGSREGASSGPSDWPSLYGTDSPGLSGPSSHPQHATATHEARSEPADPGMPDLASRLIDAAQRLEEAAERLVREAGRAAAPRAFRGRVGD